MQDNLLNREASSRSSYRDRDIAVISMSGRFPQASSIDALWRNLCAGLEAVSFFSDDELIAAGEPITALRQPNYVRAAGIVSDTDLFDAAFFGFTPREAEMLDPQQRLFLECAWEALESAGYVGGDYHGRIGVYAGCAMSPFLFEMCTAERARSSIELLQFIIANDKDFLPTRVSYKLNLHGPSVAVQTACSSSLVAVHLACQSLLAGECEAALAGGAAIRLLRKAGYLHIEGGIASSDGHCRAFDANSNGTVSGHGVGVVFLKRLSDALDDGDSIQAVIKGSATNNDGALKVGYTAPSVEGQAAVITQAIGAAGVGPDTISYVEAHGTGTALGDPIEIAALTKAFRTGTEKKQFCAVGSIKTNLGHLDVAAGVTGLIKTVLALRHKQIPPNLHFTRPNPQIDFENSPFSVNTALVPWNGPTPRRAGVSSFGIGGTNAHVILEEAPTLAASGDSRMWHLLVLSARTHAALETMTARLAAHLKEYCHLNVADVAYTLQVGRKAFPHRRALLCSSLEQAVATLETQDPKEVFTTVQKSGPPPVAFMFPGEGAQYPNMAAELYRCEPLFRKDVDLCSEVLTSRLGLDLRALLYPEESQASEAASRLHRTVIAEPALFVTEYALARLWMEWGVHPDEMIGHGIGEYAAACLAQVFTLEDALTLVAARARLTEELPEAAALAVALPEQDVRPFLGEHLSLAAVNGPKMCVMSGPPESVAAFENRLEKMRVQCRRLRGPHAFHSKLMAPVSDSFMREVRKILLNPPKIPFVSNVTGRRITPEQATDPAYWVAHLQQTARFAAGLEALVQNPRRILLEVGPGEALSTLSAENPDRGHGHVLLSSLPGAQAGDSDIRSMLLALGHLWLLGAPIQWTAFSAHERRHRVALPTYPFERKRYSVRTASEERRDRKSTSPTAPSGAPAEPCKPAFLNPTHAQAPLVRDSGAESSTPRPCRSDQEQLDAVSASLPPRRLPEREGDALGPVPLTPIQRWFFEWDLPDRHHWNMSMVLEVTPELQPSILQCAFTHLLAHHDALRSRFAQTGPDWHQVIGGQANMVLKQIDLSGLPIAEQSRAIRAHAADVQTSLNLVSGPMMQAALFVTGHGRPNQLLIVCHHLVTDVSSWRVLLEDLQTVCQQLLEGVSVNLTPKTTSFKRWAKWLNEYSRSPSLQEELPLWLAQAQQDYIGLRVHYTPEMNTVASERIITTSMDAERTELLARTMAKVHHTRLSDVLLTALTQTFAEWTGEGRLLVDMESHGREPLFADANLLRTVGWFTSLFPLLLTLERGDRPAQAVCRVKEQRRRLPHGGIGYGLLRYMAGDSSIAARLAAPRRAEVSFNFLGQHDRVRLPGSLFRPLPLQWDLDRSRNGFRDHLLAVEGCVTDAGLRVSWTYSRNVLSRSVVKSLAEECMRRLEGIVVDCEGAGNERDALTGMPVR